MKIKLAKIKLWEVVGDESLEDWLYRSRTVHPDLIANGFKQLPSVMRYSRTTEYKAGEYRVNESPLLYDYYRINDYDGQGVRRCENYLFGGANALYNSSEERGFPDRQYLTMSRNVLKEIEWVWYKNQPYLKFETVIPGATNASRMTHLTHPWFVQRFDLVSWEGDLATGHTEHTYNTPKGNVYFFLTSKEGFAFIHRRYVKEL